MYISDFRKHIFQIDRIFLSQWPPRQYRPLMIEITASGSPSNVIHSIKWIVLLGGGHTADPRVLVTSRISCESLSRLAECVRIHRLIKGSKIILSGGTVYDSSPEARTFA